MKTIIALYNDSANAQDAVYDLVDNGFERENISLVANDVNGEYGQSVSGEERVIDEAAEDTAAGAGTGAVIGGLGGLLVGLGALMIPGIGPIVAAGPLITALVSAGVGAGVGAIAGGLIGALVGIGVPEEEASYYAEGVRRGGTLVMVKVADEAADWAMEIMDRHNPIDVEERISQWQEQGWARFDPDATPYTVDALNQERELYGSYTSDRRPGYGRDFTPDPGYSSRDGAEVEPPVNEETRDVLAFDDDDYTSYDTRFRHHYDTNYAGMGYPYDQYVPAYRYGYDLAHDTYYGRREWVEVEPEARRAWEEHYEGTWDQFKDAVRHAWEEVKAAAGFDDDDTYETDPGPRQVKSQF